MRINVYAEEMTDHVELITKPNVVGEDGQPVTFYGIRFYLASPEVLHVTEHDDDTSAITFWFRTPQEALLMRECLLVGTDAVDVALARISQASIMQASAGTAHNAGVQTS